MSIRTSFAGIAAVAVSATVLGVVAPANAIYAAAPLDSSAHSATPFTPTSADVIGVGSDTTDIAVFNVAKAWNDQATAPAYRVANYMAQPQPAGGTVVLPDAVEITRPNGSGAGKKLLFGATNQTEVDFARSSSSLSTGTGSEQANGLVQIPFAVDIMQMGVSATATNAPANLTIDQIYRIYSGAVTDWSQLGGTPGTIKASALQTGSGTASFFLDQLKAYASARGLTFSFGPAIDQTWQEHSDVKVKDDPNAIAPFSIGRAALLGGTIKLETGWSKNRAVYNVVRGSQNTATGAHWDDADHKLQDLFTTEGWFCNPANKAAIEAGGLKQMLKPVDGGACGVAMTSAPSAQQLVSDKVSTTTLVGDTGETAGVLQASATVTSANGSTPSGAIDFFVDGSAVAAVANVPLSGGKAVANLEGLAAGAHTVVAKYAKAYGTAYTNSDNTIAPTTAYVRTASSVALTSSPAAGSYGTARALVATVTGAVDGTVVFTVGAEAPVNAVVTNGVATLALPANRSAGTTVVTASYLRTDAVASSTTSGSLVIAKATPAVSETFPLATLRGKPGKGIVKVAIAGSTVKPTGTVRIYQGAKLLKSATLVNGQVTITLPKLTRGKKLLTVKYLGSANVNAKSLNFYLTQR